MATHKGRYVLLWGSGFLGHDPGGSGCLWTIFNETFSFPSFITTSKPYFASGLMIETEKFSEEFISSLSYKKTRVELKNGDVIETNSICGGDREKPDRPGLKTIMLNWGVPREDGLVPLQERVRIPLEQIKSLTLLSQDSEKHPVPPLHLASFS